MTPSQADREAAAEIWQSVKRAFLKDAGPEYDDIGNTLALPYATRHRLAAEAAALEKAAGVVKKSAKGYNEEDEFERGFACACTMLSIQLGQLAGEKHD